MVFWSDDRVEVSLTGSVSNARNSLLILCCDVSRRFFLFSQTTPSPQLECCHVIKYNVHNHSQRHCDAPFLPSIQTTFALQLIWKPRPLIAHVGDKVTDLFVGSFS